MEDCALDFQKIHDEFRPKIRRYLAHLAGEFEAEDLTQEVFLKVSRNLDTFRGESQLSTWIYRIATNAALDRMRTPAYRLAAEKQSLEGAQASELEPLDQDLWTGAAAPSLEQQLHHKERAECFCSFVDQLPENYRLILVLNQIEEFTAKEIAEILGLNLNVVKIRLHRGREKLLQELKHRCKPEDWL